MTLAFTVTAGQAVHIHGPHRHQGRQEDCEAVRPHPGGRDVSLQPPSSFNSVPYGSALQKNGRHKQGLCIVACCLRSRCGGYLCSFLKQPIAAGLHRPLFHVALFRTSSTLPELDLLSQVPVPAVSKAGRLCL